MKDLRGLMEQKVEEHESTIDFNSPRDYIDKFLVEMRTTVDPASSFYGSEARLHLVNSLLDLFGAGSETTSTTLTWAVLYMAREPGVQDTVQGRFFYADRPLFEVSLIWCPLIKWTLGFNDFWCRESFKKSANAFIEGLSSQPSIIMLSNRTFEFCYLWLLTVLTVRICTFNYPRA